MLRRSAYSAGRLAVIKFISSRALNALVITSKRDNLSMDLYRFKYWEITNPMNALQPSFRKECCNLSFFLSESLTHKVDISDKIRRCSFFKTRGFTGAISCNNSRYPGCTLSL